MRSGPSQEGLVRIVLGRRVLEVGDPLVRDRQGAVGQPHNLVSVKDALALAISLAVAVEACVQRAGGATGRCACKYSESGRVPSVQKSDGCYNGDQTNKIGVQAGALSWREGAGSCILPLPSSSHPLSENMDCLFSPLADELLLKVLEDAGPHAGLRGCNKEFAMLGKDENLWKSFCTRNGVRNDSKFTSWSEAYKSAVQCRHDRGANRDLRYPAATEPSEGQILVLGRNVDLIGRALYLTASMFNHSCAPNCSVSK